MFPNPHADLTLNSNLNSPIITLSIGNAARLFAAHESILDASPFFSAITRGQFFESHSKRISLPEEIPEVFSSVLEYLYKGDYYPKLLHNKRKDTWQLEDAPPASTAAAPSAASTVYHDGAGQDLLKDTLVYCAADRYGLGELKRLALRKQGLQSGISCNTILQSARYAYANTAESDSKLRAHYLALIIRSRSIFKRSGTMQIEMEKGNGGGLWFDLFVAMCNHMHLKEPEDAKDALMPPQPWNPVWKPASMITPYHPSIQIGLATHCYV
ncbi:MAG: hypothetical protein OHK93_001573 [Ramalina farinacea]|uniref:BTB domain-containing protein n=1 Tax=Ramalina farinacea TaxID=258253 RepID=A0AA43QPQ3_9LECA|nr:hypothetical protein [Ramalina farinacea]